MRRAALQTVMALAVGLSACGGASARHAAPPPTGHTGAGGASRTAPAPAGEAKRRYLTHFRTDCRSSGRLGKAAGTVIGTLTEQIARGNLAAVAALNLFLQRLAASYQAALRGTRALGPPPGPDSRDGRAYLDQTQRMIAAIQAVGAAVGRLDAHGLHTAAGGLAAATKAADGAAKRYGFPTCGRGSSGTAPPSSVSPGAPV